VTVRRRVLVRGCLAVAAVAGLASGWSAERSSLERANRLERAGRVDEAVDLYEARTRATPSDPELRYNLGTALVALDSAAAEIELARATPGGSRELRARARYNIGVVRLNDALEAAEPDSVLAHAAAAVEANRAALRLRPGDPDTKWNLAMAARLLDSIYSFQRRSGRALDEGAVEADVVTRSVNVPDPAEDEFAEDPPAQGEDETVAVGGDESPLSPEEAEEILGTSHLDATTILEKLLANEGRKRGLFRRGSAVRRW
jgi:tetratricopeptide (TPR) repeat protein